MKNFIKFLGENINELETGPEDETFVHVDSDGDVVVETDAEDGDGFFTVDNLSEIVCEYGESDYAGEQV